MSQTMPQSPLSSIKLRNSDRNYDKNFFSQQVHADMTSKKRRPKQSVDNRSLPKGPSSKVLQKRLENLLVDNTEQIFSKKLSLRQVNSLKVYYDNNLYASNRRPKRSLQTLREEAPQTPIRHSSTNEIAHALEVLNHHDSYSEESDHLISYRSSSEESDQNGSERPNNSNERHQYQLVKD